MSITDELREYVRHYSVAGSSKDKTLTAIADRIDEAHKHATAYVDDRDPETMAEHGWVKLPVDAKGVPIHAGEMLDGYGKTIEVVEIRHGRSGWVIISRDGNGYADTFAFTHHHPPTVEDVLREFHERMDELGTTDQCVGSDRADAVDALLRERAELVAEYAAKLRLAGEGE